MIVLIVGSDTARPQARASAASAYATREQLRPNDLSGAALVERAGADTLFEDTNAYFIDASAAGTPDDVFEKETLKALSESKHLFIIEIESGADMARAVEKVGGKVVKVKAPPKEKTFEVFSLATALGKKDKKALWLLYREALDGGVEPEALIGILAWKARQMLGIKGVKDTAARKLSRDLVCLYHDSRRGAGELELLLERFILTM